MFRRNCYLEFERQLRFFKTYSKNNCELECLSNFTVNSCGCAQFYMISEFILLVLDINFNIFKIGDNTTRICMANEKNCYDEAKIRFKTEAKQLCGCFQTCSSIKYSVEIKDMAIKRQKINFKC